MAGQKREARLRARRPGHPRLSCSHEAETWMPGIADKFTQSAQGRLLWPGMTKTLRPVRVVQHVFAEIALAAVGARGGVVAEHVAVFATGGVFAGADRDIVGAADRVVVAACVNDGRLSPLKAPCEQRG